MSRDYISSFSRTLFPVQLDTDQENIDTWIKDFQKTFNERYQDLAHTAELEIYVDKAPDNDPDTYTIQICANGYLDTWSSTIMDEIFKKLLKPGQTCYLQHHISQTGEEDHTDLEICRDGKYASISEDTALERLALLLRSGSLPAFFIKQLDPALLQIL